MVIIVAVVSSVVVIGGHSVVIGSHSVVIGSLVVIETFKPPFFALVENITLSLSFSNFQITLLQNIQKTAQVLQKVLQYYLLLQPYPDHF